MANRQRTVLSGILNHCYQNTVNGNIIFYCVSDYLAYFTLFCTVAPKYRVKVPMLCLMPDHTHSSIVAGNKKELSGLMHEVTSLFSKAHNKVCNCSGPIFNTPFGSVPKKGDKAGRTNIIYVGNNPVERRLVKFAEQYRWNFLAYAKSDHPFSEKIHRATASRPMRRALKTVEDMHSKGQPLPYNMLKRLFEPLSKNECNQLTDFIISTYSIIDYDEAIRFFGTYEDMLSAMHSTTGSEYDINEVFVGKSDAYYTKMANILIKELNLADIHEILSYSTDRKFELYELLRKRTDAPGEQIAKYLRMPFRRGSEAPFPFWVPGT